MKASDMLQVDLDNVGHGKLSEYDPLMVLLEQISQLHQLQFFPPFFCRCAIILRASNRCFCVRVF